MAIPTEPNSLLGIGERFMKNKGIALGLAAYFLWGVFPIYFKLLKPVSAVQLIAHRISWSFLLLTAFLLVTQQWSKFRTVAFKPRLLLIYAISAILLSVNWLAYVWGVQQGFIVETSLGYFINPLFSVLLGVIFLRERLRPVQWLPVGLAAVGVVYLTAIYGRPPWIALTLAFSFGLYGLVKKMAPLSSTYGLTLETGIVFLPALGFLIFEELSGNGGFLHINRFTDVLLIVSGVVTVIPLLMFSSAARQVPLYLMGIMQYIAPTMQFLLGVLVYKEPFNLHQLVGFGFVWLALAIFVIEGFAHRTTKSA
jgi:chloramphenicol-sensitive protein RarD